MRTNDDGHANSVQFNSGYHDAAWEVQHGQVRVRVESGPQSTSQVSREWNEPYYWGHMHGQQDAEAGRYNGSSETAQFATRAAWAIYLA